MKKLVFCWVFAVAMLVMTFTSGVVTAQITGGISAGASNGTAEPFPRTSTAVNVPSMFFSPASLDFGEVQISDQLSKTVKIENRGTANLKVTVYGLKGSDFSVNGLKNITFNVAPKGTYKLKFTLKPSKQALSAASTEDASISMQASDDRMAPMKAKIINIPAQIKTNDAQKPLTELPLLASLVPDRKHSFEIQNDVKFNVVNNVKFTYTETGDIPFDTVNHSKNANPLLKVDCSGGSKIPADWACYGTTYYTVTGTVKGDNSDCPNCTITASGSYKYKLTGSVYEGNLQAQLKIIEVDDNWKVCCGGCGCGKEPSMVGIYFHKNVTFNPTIPFRAGGNQKLPLDFPSYSGNIWWIMRN